MRPNVCVSGQSEGFKALESSDLASALNDYLLQLSLYLIFVYIKLIATLHLGMSLFIYMTDICLTFSDSLGQSRLNRSGNLHITDYCEDIVRQPFTNPAFCCIVTTLN